MKLKIRTPLLPPLLLLPLIVLLNRPLPVLLALHVLPALLRIGFQPQGLRELELLLPPCVLARSYFRLCGLVEERGAVRACGVALRMPLRMYVGVRVRM